MRLLQGAGFEHVTVETEQFGFYLTDAEAVWHGNANSAFGLQGAAWSEAKLQRCKQTYLDEISQASTERGYFNDITMLFVTARKLNEAL